MEYITQLILKTTLQVWTTFLHNWPFLLVSIIIAVCLKLFINPEKVSAFLTRYRRTGVVGATVVAVTTPLCSCGTTAIILGMMASTIPWAPIIAFMVSSPLTSPEELIYSAGLFGWPFALAFFLSSILLGLLGGLVGEFMELRGWLKNQSRFSDTFDNGSTEPKSEEARMAMPVTVLTPITACACESASAPVFPARPSLIRSKLRNPAAAVLPLSSSPSGEAVLDLTTSCGCNAQPIQSTSEPCSYSRTAPQKETSAYGRGENQAEHTRLRNPWQAFLAESLIVGRRLLVMFFGFAFIGYFLNGLIPSAWINAIFGPGNVYSVPLAATLGLPLYINTEASLPLVRALIDGGMSQGAALAFLITGAGTSIGAIAGAFAIARWRVIAVVIGTLWIGAILLGYLYDFLRITGLL